MNPPKKKSQKRDVPLLLDDEVLWEDELFKGG
jgi:hypothetical protein